MTDAIEYIKGRIAECQNPDYMVPVHMQALDEVLARVAELKQGIKALSESKIPRLKDYIVGARELNALEALADLLEPPGEPLQGEADVN